LHIQKPEFFMLWQQGTTQFKKHLKALVDKSNHSFSSFLV